MTVQRYQIRQCEETECRCRFPIVDGATSGHKCPECGGKTRLINVPYTSNQVEIGKFVPEGAEVEALLDNIRSVFNVGNMLRTAVADLDQPPASPCGTSPELLPVPACHVLQNAGSGWAWYWKRVPGPNHFQSLREYRQS